MNSLCLDLQVIPSTIKASMSQLLSPFDAEFAHIIPPGRRAVDEVTHLVELDRTQAHDQLWDAKNTSRMTWGEIREGFQLSHDDVVHLVQRFIAWLRDHPENRLKQIKTSPAAHWLPPSAKGIL
ncbi:Nn.00g116070.m01.CDS01 [Neocucurbitaria sp. VM-36]